MADTANAKVNSLNGKAINGAIGKMKADQSFGAAAPFQVSASLDTSTGIASCTMSLPEAKEPVKLYSAPMPHAGLDTVDPKLATPLSYCPLAAAGCYSLILMMRSASQAMQLDAYSTATKAVFKAANFYDKGSVGKTFPWDEVNMDVHIQGSQPEKDLIELAKFAHDHCPSTELLETSQTISTSVTSIQTEEKVEVPTDGQINGYNVKKYQAFAAEVAQDATKANFEQSNTGVWYCQEDSKTNPGCLYEVIDGQQRYPLSTEAPVGPGKFPNPVQFCLFGAASMYLHQFALRLSVRNISIKSLSVQLSTHMNKRKVMAATPADEESRIFGPFKLHVELESNASPALVEEVRLEADEMCPAITALRGSIPLKYEVHVKK